MAEYYPLLAKAVGSLPNSTPETRRVIYERARKALIGQLRTLHPPVPEADIERESIELDRAIDRVEIELANSGLPPQGVNPSAPPPTIVKPAEATSAVTRPIARPFPPAGPSGPADRKPFMPIKTKMPVRKDPGVAPDPLGARARIPASEVAVAPALRGGDAAIVRDIAPVIPRSPVDPGGRSTTAALSDPAFLPAFPALDESTSPPETALPSGDGRGVEVDGPSPRTRLEPQRPIAPQPPTGEGGRRRLWIVPAVIGVVAVIVAVAAYMLRDTRQNVARLAPAEHTTSENEKITERVGGADQGASTSTGDNGAAATSDKTVTGPAATTGPASSNPELPVANRAALLVEATNEPNKVKTFLGSVIWKLNNVNQGPSESVGLAVQADVDLPDDKMKATVTFEKNTDASLPASHTIKVQFSLQPGSMSGDVQQISVPQLRQEDSPSGEALAGVTVPVVPNSFLVGLSPGNAEMVNIKQLQDTQWIDIPMLLSNGKIAKLTFEKGAAGSRDLDEAIASWQKS